VHRVVASPAREKKAERAKGAAARPLNGGALTRWGARTPTRGPATVPCSTVSRSFAAGALRGGERSTVKRKRGGRRAGLDPVAVFLTGADGHCGHRC